MTALAHAVPCSSTKTDLRRLSAASTSSHFHVGLTLQCGGDSASHLLQVDLTKQWRGEKDDMERLQSVKEEIDRVNLEIQGAERDYDLNRAAELKYGTLMDLQKQLKGAEVALEKQVSPVASVHQQLLSLRWIL